MAELTQGNVSNIEGTTTYNHDTNGWSTTFERTGYQDQLAPLELLWAGYDARTTLEQTGDGDTWHLTAVFAFDTRQGDSPTNTEPQVIWNIKDVETNISLLDIDVPVNSFITATGAKLIQSALKDNNKSILENGLKLLLTKGKTTQDEINCCYIAYEHMAKGMKTLPSYYKVLVKSAVASTQWEINWSNEHVGELYSTTTLKNEENVPQALWKVLPDKTYTTPTNQSAYLNYTYGWLKGGVNTDLTSLGRCKITQQWTYGLWPVLYLGRPR